MLDLGELRYAFILVPIVFIFTMYLVSGDTAILGVNFLLSIIASTIIAVITAEIPLTGNSEGTYIAFVVGFALTFWGLSIAGFSGFNILNWTTVPYQPSNNWQIVQSPTGGLYIAPPNTQLNNTATFASPLSPNNMNFGAIMPNFGGWSGGQIWGTIVLILSFMYCIGIYFMVSSRGK